MALEKLMLAGSDALQVAVGGCSRSGPKPINQDAFAAFVPESASQKHLKGVTLTLADGVSSGKQSQEASQMAVMEFIDEYYATAATWSVRQSARKVLEALNGWLFAQNHNNHFQQLDVDDGRVCTFTSAIIKGHRLYICHAGDSRAWLLRDGELRQLTKDHVRRYSGQWVLTRALGIEEHLDLDIIEERLQSGDLLMLSTDGLHGFLDHARLTELMSATLFADDLESQATAMVEQALASDSDDNVSCLLARIDSLPEESLDDAHQRLSQLALPPVLKTGNVIDGMEVLRVLHNSTRSLLYQVRRQSDDKVMVLKTPSPNFADDTLYLEAFVREHWLGRQLESEYLIAHYESPADSRFLYSLIEYAPGQTLEEWRQDNPRPSLDAVRDILESVVEGLRRLQRAGVVHRDLKPDNVMIDEHGRCKLLDLGAASAPGLDELGSVVSEDIPLGSVNYIAPEYLLSGKASNQSDLFSLGCLIYELLTGGLPYDMEDSQRKLPQSFADWHYRPARRKRPELPLWVEVALQTATQPNPQQRYAAFSEFVQDMSRPGEIARKREHSAPLLERYPQRFWQVLSAVLAVIVLIESYLLLS